MKPILLMILALAIAGGCAHSRGTCEKSITAQQVVFLDADEREWPRETGVVGSSVVDGGDYWDVSIPVRDGAPSPPTVVRVRKSDCFLTAPLTK